MKIKLFVMFLLLGVAVYAGMCLLIILCCFFLGSLIFTIYPSVQIDVILYVLLFVYYNFLFRKMLKYIPLEFYPEVFWCVVLLILLFILSCIFDFLKTPIIFIGEVFGMSRFIISIADFYLHKLSLPYISDDGWIVIDLLLVFYLVLYNFYLRNFRDRIRKHIKDFFINLIVYKDEDESK
jgi:hypothetical protein